MTLRDLSGIPDETSKVIETITRREQSWRPIYDQVMLHESKGLNLDEIAKKTRLPVDEVKKIRRTPDYQERYKVVIKVTQEQLTKEITDKLVKSTKVDEAIEYLSDKAEWAVKKLYDLAKKGTATQRIQLDACREILDRANIKSPDVNIVEHREHTPDPKELLQIKNTLIEIEAIRQRLSNQDSGFLLTNKGSEPLVKSSETDDGSNVHPQTSVT